MFKSLKSQSLIMMMIVTGCVMLAGCTNSSEGMPANIADPAVADQIVEKTDDLKETLDLPAVEDTLPEGFPTDIPILEGAFANVSMSFNDSMTVSYDVNKSFQEVYKVYKNFLKSSYNTDMYETLIEDSYVGTGTADGKQLTVTLSVNTDDPNLTSVMLTYRDALIE